MRKHFLILVLFLITYLVGFSQTVSMDRMKKALTEAGIENVVCVENDSVYILTIENNIWKLKGTGLQAIIRQLPPYHKPVRIIVLDNAIPRFLISLPVSDNKALSDVSVSYRINPYWDVVKHDRKDNSSSFKVDIVVYPEISFRNIKLEKMYDWLVNLSPAIEFSAWKGMKFTGQVIFPLVNQYGEQYKQIRPGYITVSQQVRFPYNWFAKVTTGIFNQDRWGMDLKLFRPLTNQRFALKMQAGLTGASSFWNWQWYYSVPERLTWSIGGQYYNPRYNVQCQVSTGRYLAGDYGMRVDMMRHFRHSTVGFYGLKTNKSNMNGGFYITVALPPYKQKRNKIRITTAGYFNLEYNAGADFYYGRIYKTDPGENVSQENFNPFFIKSEL